MGSGQSVDDLLARALLPELWHEVGSWLLPSERWFLAENIPVLFSDRYQPPFTPEAEHRDDLKRLVLWNKTPESKTYPRDVTSVEATQHPGRDFKMFYPYIVGVVGRMHRCNEQDLQDSMESGQRRLIHGAFQHELLPFHPVQDSPDVRANHTKVPENQTLAPAHDGTNHATVDARPFIHKSDAISIRPENRGTLTHVLDWSYRRHPNLWNSIVAGKSCLCQWNRYGESAARAVTTDLLKWMYSIGTNYWNGPIRSDWFTPKLIGLAIEAHQDQNVLWMKEKGLEWPSNALALMVQHNRIQLLKHDSARELHPVTPNHKEDYFLIRMMARHSTAEVWDFVVGKRKLVNHAIGHQVLMDAFSTASLCGNLPVMQRIQHNGAPWDASWCTGRLIHAPNAEIIEWLLLNGASTPTNSKTVEHYVRLGAMHLVEHVRHREWTDANGVVRKHDPWPWSEKCCQIAFERNDINMLNWLIENGCPCPQSLKDLIAFRSNLLNPPNTS